MVCHGDHSKEDTVWLVDTGCSNHMTRKKRLFTYLDENYKHIVRLGDDQELSIEGLGTVGLNVGDRGVRLLHDV